MNRITAWPTCYEELNLNIQLRTQECKNRVEKDFLGHLVALIDGIDDYAERQVPPVLDKAREQYPQTISRVEERWPDVGCLSNQFQKRSSVQNDLMDEGPEKTCHALLLI
jgi:hypothetical protein